MIYDVTELALCVNRTCALQYLHPVKHEKYASRNSTRRVQIFPPHLVHDDQYHIILCVKDEIAFLKSICHILFIFCVCFLQRSRHPPISYKLSWVRPATEILAVHLVPSTCVFQDGTCRPFLFYLSAHSTPHNIVSQYQISFTRTQSVIG